MTLNRYKYLCLWVCLVVSACNGCALFKEKDAGSNDVVRREVDLSYALARTLVDSLPRSELGSANIEKLRQLPTDASLLAEVRSIFKEQGLKGLQYYALDKGLLIPPSDSLPLGIFEIVKREGAVLILRPTVRIDEDLPEPFIAITQIDGVTSLLLSESGLEKIPVYDSGRLIEKEKQLFGQEMPWQEALFVAATKIGTTASFTKEAEHCGLPQRVSFHSLITTTFSSRLTSFSRSVKDGDSGYIIARKFSQIFSEVECPASIFHVIGKGLSPDLFFSDDRAISMVRLAFLGTMARKCAVDGHVDLRALGPCAWRTIATSKQKDLVELVASLGNNPLDWEYAKLILEQYANDTPKSSAVIKGALGVGIQAPAFFDKLGLKFAKTPASHEYFVTILPTGQDKAPETVRMEANFSQPPVALPLVTATLAKEHPGFFDNCDVPVFWDKAWWRVCPVEDKKN